MKSLFQFLEILTSAERRRLKWVVALMTVGVGLEALTLGLVAPASSLILGEGRKEYQDFIPAPLLDISAEAFVAVLLGAGVLFILLKNAFIGFQYLVQYRYIASLKESLSSRLFEKYLGAAYPFHLKRNSSQLIRNVINEVNELELRILLPCMALFTDILVSSGIILVLLFLDPLNTLAVGVLLGLAGLAYLLLTKGKMAHWGKVRLHSEEQRIRTVQQTLGAIKEVKLLGLEESSLALYQVHNSLSARSFSVSAFISQLPRLLLEVVVFTAVILVVLLSMLKGQPFEEIITSLGLLGVAAFRLLPSVNRIIVASGTLRFGGASIDNIAKELSQEIQMEKDEEEGESEDAITFQKSIGIRNVSFSYGETDRKVLDRVSFEIPRNAFVGIVGESGSGKSTLIDITLGLLAPTEGRVEVDGVPIRRNLRSWQNRLAYVPQQIFLADTTIRENIAFGIPSDEIDDERITEVLRLANIEKFVETLPDGTSAEVGERGVRLSGGQCQRIGIARALYRDPEVIVFDEATSALDDDSQEKVMEAIRGLKGSRTIIMVSHRVSTIDYCDAVFEVKLGKCSQVRASEVGSRVASVEASELKP